MDHSDREPWKDAASCEKRRDTLPLSNAFYPKAHSGRSLTGAVGCLRALSENHQRSTDYRPAAEPTPDVKGGPVFRTASKWQARRVTLVCGAPPHPPNAQLQALDSFQRTDQVVDDRGTRITTRRSDTDGLREATAVRTGTLAVQRRTSSSGATTRHRRSRVYCMPALTGRSTERPIARPRKGARNACGRTDGLRRTAGDDLDPNPDRSIWRQQGTPRT